MYVIRRLKVNCSNHEQLNVSVVRLFQKRKIGESYSKTFYICRYMAFFLHISEIYELPDHIAICDYSNKELCTDGLHLSVQIPHTLQQNHRHAVPTPQTANKYQTRHCRAVRSITVNSNFVFCVQNAAEYQKT